MAQCFVGFDAGAPLFFSVLLAGLVGSFTHCSVMCSPLVAAQMMQLQARGQAQWSLLYYHAGRVATYMLLGALAVLAANWLFSGAFKPFANAMLIVAGGVFVLSALIPRRTHSHCNSHPQQWINRVERVTSSQVGLFLRGFMMGFMPCGMTLAIILVVATLDSPFYAMALMLVFGLTTVPVLHVTGFGAVSLSKQFPQTTHRASRGVMALNGLWLCGLGFNWVSLN